ncbi:hypothetical protein ADUPG1_009241, partial [Aduncisulcus paluster]
VPMPSSLFELARHINQKRKDSDSAQNASGKFWLYKYIIQRGGEKAVLEEKEVEKEKEVEEEKEEEEKEEEEKEEEDQEVDKKEELASAPMPPSVFSSAYLISISEKDETMVLTFYLDEFGITIEIDAETGFNRKHVAPVTLPMSEEEKKSTGRTGKTDKIKDNAHLFIPVKSGKVVTQITAFDLCIENPILPESVRIWNAMKRKAVEKELEKEASTLSLSSRGPSTPSQGGDSNISLASRLRRLQDTAHSQSINADHSALSPNTTSTPVSKETEKYDKEITGSWWGGRSGRGKVGIVSFNILQRFDIEVYAEISSISGRPTIGMQLKNLKALSVPPNFGAKEEKK